MAQEYAVNFFQYFSVNLALVYYCCIILLVTEIHKFSFRIPDYHHNRLGHVMQVLQIYVHKNVMADKNNPAKRNKVKKAGNENY